MFINCIVCDTPLKVMNPPLDSSSNIDGGVVESIYAGWGSIHDGKSGLIAVCDGCLEKKKVFARNIENEINLLVEKNHELITKIERNKEEIKELKCLL